MTRTELQEYLKDLYKYLSPDEKRYICERYQEKFSRLDIPVLKAYQLQNDKSPLQNLKDFLLERKNGKSLAIPAQEIPLEEQNQKIEDFVRKL
jgi:hypothetical protein